MSALDPDFISRLRCPVTRSSLRQDGDHLVSETGSLKYPVRSGIPILLPDAAELPPGIDSLDAFRARHGRPVRGVVSPPEDDRSL